MKASLAAPLIPERRLPLDIHGARSCACPPNHLNCMTAKDWMKSQIGVWQFSYEGRDVRDKKLHPAAYPIALARRCIELFTHQGELVQDPFVGSGTTLLAARDCGRNAVGFDLNQTFVALCRNRLHQQPPSVATRQLPIHEDARNISRYLPEQSVSLFLTSPPYANLLNRRRTNKSRRGDHRLNEQLGKIEQYSFDSLDLGTLSIQDFQAALTAIYRDLLPLLRPRSHCVVNVADIWWNNERIPLHLAVVEALRSAGYQLRNTIIWDRRNLVNQMGIFGWPRNYITAGVTFEYILDFWRPG